MDKIEVRGKDNFFRQSFGKTVARLLLIYKSTAGDYFDYCVQDNCSKPDRNGGHFGPRYRGSAGSARGPRRPSRQCRQVCSPSRRWDQRTLRQILLRQCPLPRNGPSRSVSHRDRRWRVVRPSPSEIIAVALFAVAVANRLAHSSAVRAAADNR